MKIQALLIAAAFTIAAPFSQALAGYNFKMSTSPTDHAAGSTLVLNGIGDTGSLYVWASTGVGQTLTGISLDYVASDPTVVNTLSHSTENPGLFIPRWSGLLLQDGAWNVDPNLLVDDTNAATFFTETGISTNGDANFVLHSTLNVEATDHGTTTVSLEDGVLGLADGLLPVSANFGTGATITAVPEPSSITALIGGAVCFTLRRRRKLA